MAQAKKTVSGSMSRQAPSREIEPTAPPIHMMPQSYAQLTDDRANRDRSPPPRYEEAIAEGWTSPPPVSTRERIPLSPHRRLGPTSQQNSRRSGCGEPSSCDSSRISSPAQSPEHSRTSGQDGARRSRSCNSRYRSASPGGFSNQSHEDSDNSNEVESRSRSGDRTRRSERTTTANKKRGSGSKIKKGLENIAFFIIQLLD